MAEETHLRFPPEVGQVVHGYQLESRLKSSKFCIVSVCHHISDILTKYVIKIAINGEAKKLSKEIECYKGLTDGQGIPKLIFDKRHLS